MSPTKSDAERLAAIEALVCRDVGRKTQQMIEASTGELARAAAALAGATSVGLITGFFVPRGDVAAPETDGPVGTALLAAALAAHHFLLPLRWRCCRRLQGRRHRCRRQLPP